MEKFLTDPNFSHYLTTSSVLFTMLKGTIWAHFNRPLEIQKGVPNLGALHAWNQFYFYFWAKRHCPGNVDCVSSAFFFFFFASFLVYFTTFSEFGTNKRLFAPEAVLHCRDPRGVPKRSLRRTAPLLERFRYRRLSGPGSERRAFSHTLQKTACCRLFV